MQSRNLFWDDFHVLYKYLHFESADWEVGKTQFRFQKWLSFGETNGRLHNTEQVLMLDQNQAEIKSRSRSEVLKSSSSNLLELANFFYFARFSHWTLCFAKRWKKSRSGTITEKFRRPFQLGTSVRDSLISALTLIIIAIPPFSCDFDRRKFGLSFWKTICKPKIF